MTENQEKSLLALLVPFQRLASQLKKNRGSRTQNNASIDVRPPAHPPPAAPSGVKDLIPAQSPTDESIGKVNPSARAQKRGKEKEDNCAQNGGQMILTS
jgi:hypothetical protein